MCATTFHIRRERLFFLVPEVPLFLPATEAFAQNRGDAGFHHRHFVWPLCAWDFSLNPNVWGVTAAIFSTVNTQWHWAKEINWNIDRNWLVPRRTQATGSMASNNDEQNVTPNTASSLVCTANTQILAHSLTRTTKLILPPWRLPSSRSASSHLILNGQVDGLASISRSIQAILFRVVFVKRKGQK